MRRKPVLIVHPNREVVVMRMLKALILLVPLSLASSALAATLHVPDEYANIQTAIDAAADGDTVSVGTGTYTGVGNNNLLLLNKTLSLVGEGPGFTVIDCELLARALTCIQATDHPLSMKGIGIVNGQFPGQGGALFFSGGSVQLENISIDGCTTTGDGGGIYADNLAQFGAWDLQVNDCDAGGEGGAIHLADIGDLNLNGCRITGCTAVAAGGGLYLDDVVGQIGETLVAGNECAAECGGISVLSASDLDLNQVTLAGNIGSALKLTMNCIVDLDESIIALNDGGPGAIDALSYFNLDIACCDVYGNLPTSYGVFGDQTGQDLNISVDPLFCEASAGNYELEALSPCLPDHNDCNTQLGALGQGCLSVSDALHVPGDYPDLSAAVDAAQQGDTILVAPGTYTGSQNRDVSFEGKALHFIGAAGSANTVIDCQGIGRAFESSLLPDSAVISIQGFTLLNGDTDGSGGAIFLQTGAIVNLRDLVIRDCEAGSFGGGIMVSNCAAGSEMADLAVTGCAATHGGGLYVENAQAELRDILLAGNSASLDEGGGLFSGVDNQVVISGLTVDGCIGGGVFFASGASGDSHDFSASIVSNTLGDAPAIDISIGGLGNITFTCNDVWGNDGGNFSEEADDLSGQPGNFSIDPLYCDPAGGDYSLSFDSACLPAGNSCGVRVGAFGEGCGGVEQFVLSGHVLDQGGAGIGGVSVIWGAIPALTQLDGSYSFIAHAGWTGSSHVEGGSFDYSPASYDYTDLQADQPDQDFTGTRRSLCRIPDDYPNLDEAVDGCLSGDTILVAAGLYSGEDNGQIALTGGMNLTIIGEGGSAGTIIEGAASQLGPMFIFNGAQQNSHLVGLTFRNASFDAWSDDRGFLVNGASPVFEDVVFENLSGPGGYWNSSSAKTLLCVGEGSPELIDCVFRSNYSRYEPISISGGTPRFTRVLFEQNDCTEGTVGVSGGSPVFVECTFAGNTANVTWLDDAIQVPGAGGALAISGGTPLLEDCLFNGNTAEVDLPNVFDSHGGSGKGGAVYQSGGEATFRRCTFHGNTAEPFETHQGGGFAIFGGSLILEQTIVAAGGDGGGIYLDDVAHSVAMTCNDVWSNNGGNYLGALADQTGLNGNISEDPLFCDAPGGDFTIMSSSPCLPENNDCVLRMGAYGEGCQDGTAAEDIPLPSEFALLQNRPNPFNPSTEILFSLPKPTRVALSIFDLAGRRILTLVDDETFAAGRHAVTWQGRDENNLRQASGVYFYRLVTKEFSQTKKMLLLK